MNGDFCWCRRRGPAPCGLWEQPSSFPLSDSAPVSMAGWDPTRAMLGGEQKGAVLHYPLTPLLWPTLTFLACACWQQALIWIWTFKLELFLLAKRVLCTRQQLGGGGAEKKIVILHSQFLSVWQRGKRFQDVLSSTCIPDYVNSPKYLAASWGLPKPCFCLVVVFGSLQQIIMISWSIKVIDSSCVLFC